MAWHGVAQLTRKPSREGYRNNDVAPIADTTISKWAITASTPARTAIGRYISMKFRGIHDISIVVKEVPIRHTGTCISAVLLLTACHSSPTAPTPVPIVRYALSGVVRVAGVRVAGATVGLVKFGAPAPDSAPGSIVWLGGEELTALVVTDESGSYSFPTAENVSFSGALVSVSRPEYFTDTKYILMSQDRTLDFDLERAVHIAVGQVVKSQIGEAHCASFGYGGMGGPGCRRFALSVPASGRLEVALSSAPVYPFDITVLRPNGTIAVYGGSSFSPVRVTLRVEAGLTYQIDAVHASPAAREFELTTTLR